MPCRSLEGIVACLFTVLAPVALCQDSVAIHRVGAYDPDMGMIHLTTLTTGSPVPDLHGGVRPGDNLFSVSVVALYDTLAQVTGEHASGSAPTGPRILAETALRADLDNGSTIYDHACAACHGEFGQGGQDGGPALSGSLNLSDVILVVKDGRNTMPSFDVFTDQQLLDIGTFVTERLYR